SSHSGASGFHAGRTRCLAGDFLQRRTGVLPAIFGCFCHKPTRNPFMKPILLSSTIRILVAGILLAVASLASAQSRQRLDNGWEFHQGSLGSTWEIWRGDRAADNVSWQPVTLPHCFNARDSVDPDVHYYQGPGWYRTRLKLENPFPNGRTLLHFDGAGQNSQVFVGM